MKSQVQVATICMTSRADKAANLATAEQLIADAAHAGAQWVLLPELFTYHGPYPDLWAAAETEDGPLNQRLATLARQHNIVLFAGSVPERPSDQEAKSIDLISSKGHKKVFNTAYVFGRDGQKIAKYRKVHLFNLNDAQRGLNYCESDGYLSGNDTTRTEIDGWKIALCICYDLRFTGFFGKLATPDVPDIIVIPSAFTKTTGEAHWELLLRARAVEWQSYVIAANQVGEHAPGKQSFGHSMIIDPWGEKLADTGAKAGFVLATLDPRRLDEVRSRLPAIVNRRQDLY